MNNAIQNIEQELKEASIKTPFEKMRARTIISAELNAEGLSLINFNLPTFLSYSKRNSGKVILNLWAIHPIKTHTAKFHAQPEAGKQALYKRVDMLASNLQQRKDLPTGFLETAINDMKATIDQEISYITGDSTQQSA